jgi:hypothetical protein
MSKPKVWAPEVVGLEPAVIQAAYARVRDAIIAEPLFSEDASNYGVSIDALDAMVKNTPTSIQGEKLYTWLDGADQFRWAGLRILHEAMRKDTVTRLEGRQILAQGCTALVTGDLVIDGDLLLEAQAMLMVLGRLEVMGVLVGDTADYSMIAAHDIECAAGYSNGEVLAIESVRCPGAFYFSGNDYSARAREWVGGTLVDFERGNFFTHVNVQKRLREWKFDVAHAELGVAPDEELADGFVAKLLG